MQLIFEIYSNVCLLSNYKRLLVACIGAGASVQGHNKPRLRNACMSSISYLLSITAAYISALSGAHVAGWQTGSYHPRSGLARIRCCSAFQRQDHCIRVRRATTNCNRQAPDALMQSLRLSSSPRSATLARTTARFTPRVGLPCRSGAHTYFF